ncbi:BQ2448_5654 [Microbotryum intermedium]|uniref:BQ2448_5654 protein n=1 Tax=Microbotryum intermedium TaxID=269621 RepID=A0A238F743_9BASI|nr:BQ2448_5654 [Microbotryum intermedium]
MMMPSTSSSSTVHASSSSSSALLSNTVAGAPLARAATNMASTSANAATTAAISTTTTNTAHRQNLLRQLVLSSLPHSAVTALFFAERLHALDPSTEASVFLYAFVLANNQRHHEAIWHLRQPVTFHPLEHVPPSTASPTVDPFNSTSMPHPIGYQASRRWPAHMRLTRPSIDCSLRCARLYASTCSKVDRHREARDVLAKILSTTQPLVQPDPATDAAIHAAVSAPSSSLSSDATYVLDLEMARLARQSGEHERAIQSYRKALDKHPWCWEALEGLCAEGAPPDPDVLYPPRPTRTVRPAPTSIPISPMPSSNGNNAHAPPSRPPLAAYPSHPAPLGPSQSSTVNSAFTFNAAAANKPTSSGGFFTPGDAAAFQAGGAGAKGKEVKPERGGLFGFGPGVAAVSSIWRKGRAQMAADISEASMEDSSFDTSFYPQPFNLQNNGHAHASSSNSLFAPPTVVNIASNGVAPGVKRTRGGSQAQTPNAATTSLATPNNGGDEDMRPSAMTNAAPSKRVARGGPSNPNVATETGSKHRRDGSIGSSSAAPATRRSSRLSRDHGSSNGITGGGSVSMALTRSQLSANGGGAATTRSAAARDKKRSKAGAGPSVFSDAGSEALSPPSMTSSSPAPSSPGTTMHPPPTSTSMQQVSIVDAAMQEAEDYVAHLLRCFAAAATNAAQFESAQTIEALLLLPVEQQRTWRCLVGIAKAHLELLNYEKAEKAFAQARQAAPHLLDSMELYSTLLWHLRLSTSLSFLAQDLMLIAPRSSVAWIASGNVFSHLEDHGSALQCFKRAAQLDPNCVYAYTLSGHECVMLEEWETALVFFRDAVRRDRRHYNAWFGLGNVYLQTGKYRLAEYHFRHAMAINPTNATLLACVGSVLEKLGRRKDALEIYERACLLAPESAAVRFKRVRILLHLKRYDEAERDLLTLKNRAPNEFNVHFLLGKLYKVLGRKSEMLKHFGMAQDLEPRTASLIREQVEKNAAEGGAGAERGMEVDEA